MFVLTALLPLSQFLFWFFTSYKFLISATNHWQCRTEGKGLSGYWVKDSERLWPQRLKAQADYNVTQIWCVGMCCVTLLQHRNKQSDDQISCKQIIETVVMISTLFVLLTYWRYQKLSMLHFTVPDPQETSVSVIYKQIQWKLNEFNNLSDVPTYWVVFGQGLFRRTCMQI